MVRVMDVASQGLVYCLDRESGPMGELPLDDFKEAVLLVMQSQEFDSIPLVKEIGSKNVVCIARRTYIEADPIVILTKSAMAECRRDASLLEGVIRLLGSEHHMVYLKETDEASEYTDVLTPCMLRERDVIEFFTLLAYKVHTETGSDFLGENANLLAYISELESKIETYTSCFQGNNGEGVEDARKNLRTHLESLMSAHPSEFEPSLSRKLPLHESESAALYAPRPFGQLHIHSTHLGDNICNLAFQLFTKANDWDTLLTDKKDGKRDLLEKTREGFIRRSIKKVEPSTGLTELVELFNQDYKPVWFDHDDGYPRIVSPADVVFHPTTRQKMGEQAAQLEREIAGRAYEKVIQQGIIPVGKSSEISSFKDNIARLAFPGIHAEQLSKVVELRNKLFHGEFGLTSESTSSSIAARKYHVDFLATDVQETLNSHLEINGPVNQLVQIFEMLDTIIMSLGGSVTNAKNYFPELKKYGLKKYKFGAGNETLQLRFYPLIDTQQKVLCEHESLYQAAGVSLEFDRVSFQDAYGKFMDEWKKKLHGYTLDDFLLEKTEDQILAELKEAFGAFADLPSDEFKRMSDHNSGELRKLSEERCSGILSPHPTQQDIRNTFLDLLTRMADERIIIDLKLNEISICKRLYKVYENSNPTEHLVFEEWIKFVCDDIKEDSQSFSFTPWYNDDGKIKGIRVRNIQFNPSPLNLLMNTPKTISLANSTITDDSLLDAVEHFIHDKHEEYEPPVVLEKVLNKIANRKLFLSWLEKKHSDTHTFSPVVKKKKINSVEIETKQKPPQHNLEEMEARPGSLVSPSSNTDEVDSKLVDELFLIMEDKHKDEPLTAKFFDLHYNLVKKDAKDMINAAKSAGYLDKNQRFTQKGKSAFEEFKKQSAD